MQSRWALILRYKLKDMDSRRDNDTDYLDHHSDERNTYQVHFKKIPVIFSDNLSKKYIFWIRAAVLKI